MADNLQAATYDREADIRVKVCFYSYLKEWTGCAELNEKVRPGTTLGQLHSRLVQRYPPLSRMQKSTLLAVGVDYQPPDYVLKADDEVSLFPPVQGG